MTYIPSLGSDASAHGCEIVAQLTTGGGYDWEECTVFRRKSDGELRWAHGSGCSCNGFLESEDFEDLDKLPETIIDLERSVREEGWNVGDAMDFMAKVYEALK